MTDNATNSTRRLVIRISKSSLSFSTTEGEEVKYEPYALNSSISIAANMREALRTVEMLRQPYHRVLVMVDAPVLMVPAEEFDESAVDEQYRHAFTRVEQQVVMYTVLADLNAVAVFAMPKDLRTVLTDAFESVRFVAALTPLWNHLNKRSYTGQHGKLFAYFHEKHLDVCSFAQNRFRFCNSYEVSGASDAIYYMLAVWKQLGLSADHDELFLTGDIVERDELKEELDQFIKRIFIVNPVGEFNRASVAQIKGIPYDLVTLYVKGL